MNSVAQTHGPKCDQTAHAKADGPDFFSRFCEKFDCNSRAFKKRVFVECIPPRGVLMARVIRLLNPGLFKADFDLIEKIKHAASFDELKRAVDFHGAQNAPKGVIRLVLKVRVSKHRLLDLAKRLFRPPD